MTRDEAVRRLCDSIERLPLRKRATALAVLARLSQALERGARTDVLQGARNDLLALLPGLEAAVDRIRVEQVLYPPTPKPVRVRQLVTSDEAIATLRDGLKPFRAAQRGTMPSMRLIACCSPSMSTQRTA